MVATTAATAPKIEIHGERMSVHFTDFSAASYPTFLRVKKLEGDMLENLLIKQEKHEAAIAEMEWQYIEAQKRLRLAA